jgi:Ca-activated chloride channel homolog
MRRLPVLLASVAALTACVPTAKSTTSTPSSTPAVKGNGANCTKIDMAVSSEKATLMTELANDFNATKAKVAGKCVFVNPYTKSSGGAAQLIVDGWPDPATNGPQPAVWSPAASGWGAIVDQRSGKTIAPPGSQAIMLTPLVIAMPKPMADALGYPAKPIGFADIVKLANDPQGWAAYGHPEWGPFRLGKTNPNFSTSGLNFTIAEYYAATGKKSGLSVEDLAKPDVQALTGSVESAVVHYGDITMTFMNNWYRADARGTALTYASAVAVEEKSVIDYNTGNPDGILSPGEVPRVPKIPLVAIYPTEGTLFSDSPFIILDAGWVTQEQKDGAKLFEDFVQKPENQQKALKFGFRPGNTTVNVGDPINIANGVDPTQPKSELEVPQPAVLTGILDAWAQQRKSARVMIVLDISGSMSEDGGDGRSKIDLAKEAAIASLDEFKDDDQVGFAVFTTDVNQNHDGGVYKELVPVQRIGGNKEKLRNQIDAQIPLNGTPLYEASQKAFDAMRASYDPKRINAVVLLTDGVNDDGNTADDATQLSALINDMRSGTEGSQSTPVRMFTISYGADADKATLLRIAEASNAALYDASKPATIKAVFTAVVSNF